MSYTETEDIQYCTNCGSVNKKSDVLCDECGKMIIVRHRPFWDFVKKHAGTGVKEKLKSDLYEVLKNFLFRHLYGTVVSFLVALTVTITVVTSSSYIKNVSEFPEQTASGQNGAVHNVELNEAVQESLNFSVMLYDAKVSAGSFYVKDGFNWEEPEKYADATELFAENNIEGYQWRGRHDMYPAPVDIEFGEDMTWEYSSGEKRPTEYRDWVQSSIVTGADVTSELGKELYKNGYDVAEGDYYIMMFYNLFEYDFDAPPPLEKNPYKLLKYRILLTKKPEGNTWHIAEDILEERKGV